MIGNIVVTPSVVKK